MSKKNKISTKEFKAPEEKFGTGTGEEMSSHLGIILGILITLLAIVLIALYAWSLTFQGGPPVTEQPAAERPTAEENNEPESNNAEADVQLSQTLSPSDELSALEADIENTNLDWLESDMGAIGAAIEDSIQ